MHNFCLPLDNVVHEKLKNFLKEKQKKFSGKIIVYFFKNDFFTVNFQIIIKGAPLFFQISLGDVLERKSETDK